MTTVTQGSKWKKADLAWLGLAVATHAGLLLLPLEVRIDKPPPLPQRLILELVNWRAQAETLVPEVNDAIPETVAPASPPDPEALVEALHREALMDLADPSEHPAETDAVTSESDPLEDIPLDRLSAALLLHSASQPELPKVESGSKQILGVYSPRGMPTNWHRGNPANEQLTAESGLDIVVAPARTEIVDRWLDAQGGHNVVVNLPNGDTYCGHAQAWDPMQPLVEHIMMFRPCGGGGKRTFDMASRPTPRWSTAQ